MQLTNKQVIYSCVNENETLKLAGTIHFNDENLITQFNGTFETIEDEACGDFYYNETVDGKVNKATNNIPADLVDQTSDLLLATVAEIKKEVL